MSRFQIIIMIAFVVIAVVAALIFGGVLPGFKGKGSRAKGPEITMWGVFDRRQIRDLVKELNDSNRALFKINYTAKNPSSYEDELINALAAGKGPDAWIISQDIILKNKDKIFTIPFESFSERSFKDSFIDFADLYVDEDKGIMGIPVAVDPIVLYWNRDLFSGAGIARVPQYWDEFVKASEILTMRDQAGNIMRSGTALGEFRNIRNAKDILSILILQTGNKVIDPDTLEVIFDERGKMLISPAENAVRFFNEFSNPRKTSYSWNRVLPNSDDMFVNGSLAMYFGYASEFPGIKKRNPHLNFDVAVVPQDRGGAVQATFGKIYSLVISKSSRFKQASLLAAGKISGKEVNGQFAEALSLAPARRDLLVSEAKEPEFSVFYKSAVMARAWLEPDPDEVYKIFQNLVESTATGKARISTAVKGAGRQIQELLK